MKAERKVELKTESHPILGVVCEDLAGTLLGTEYVRYRSPSGVHGLAKWNDSRLDLLAVFAKRPGTGQFRRFIGICKASFDTVCVWEVWNPILGPILSKYGFSPETEVQGDGEILTGWRWDKKITAKTP